MPVSVVALFPLPSNFTGINYTCLSICDNLQNDELSVRVVTPMVRPAAKRSFVTPVVPSLFTGLPYASIRPLLDYLTGWSFLRAVSECDAAYLWSEVPLRVSRALKDRGILVFREKFNCHKAVSRRILDDAYARLGMPPAHGLTDEAIEKEREELDLADYVFSPSPLVERSLIDEGVPGERIIASSYGWEAARFPDHQRDAPRDDGLTVLFVGELCVRKGVHLLLEAWKRARIRGRLVLVGRVAPDIGTHCANLLDRPDVVTTGQIDDVGRLFRSADVFAFPSLEESGPLVTYEAMACSVPVLVSPMGGGAVVEDGVHGLVREPYDVDAWVDALRYLAESPEQRAVYGAAGRKKIEKFTWADVGARRRAAILQRCGAGSASFNQVGG